MERFKQFNLKEYLANPSRKVKTRYGNQVRILCTDANMKNPIVALIRKADDTECVKLYNIDGSYADRIPELLISVYDLVFDD